MWCLCSFHVAILHQLLIWFSDFDSFVINHWMKWEKQILQVQSQKILCEDFPSHHHSVCEKCRYVLEVPV